MKTSAPTVNCPKCAHAFNVEEVLVHQIKHQYESEWLKKEQAFKKREATLNQRQTEINELVETQLAAEKEALRNQLRTEVQADQQLELQSWKERTQKQGEELLQFKKQQVQHLQEKQDLERKKQELELDVQKQLLEGRNKIEADARQKSEEQFYMKLREKDELVEGLKQKMDEMKRKAEQGSMQAQGEVQEIALAEVLTATFPFDQIEEVPTRTRGADLLQTVISPYQHNCGKIIYESKRTKAFSDIWIDKLKDDMRSKGAGIAVIVTETLPKNMVRFGQKDGVWICTFSEVSSLAYILREMLIREYSVRALGEKKGDKMSLLYDYLTGPEFRQQVEAIADAFTTMQDDLTKEKRAMMNIWKKREKQIEKVIHNTLGLYGSVQGIGGNVIQSIPLLELPEGEKDAVI